jgi:hypothetical protein
MYLKKTGNGCDLSFSVYSNSSTVPGAAQTLSGSVTAVTLPADFITTSLAYVYVPLPVTGLSTSTTYWIVAKSGDINGNNLGDAGNYVTFEKSNQVTGAATYTTTWATQSYGFMYSEFDQTSAALPLTMIYEDGGARWTYIGWSNNKISSINEYTVSQGTGQMRSVRSITFPGSTPTVVA